MNKTTLPTSKLFMLATLIFLSVTTVSAQVWTSVQDGNWNSPATWGGGSHPPATLGAGKKVNIRHSVNINSSFASTLSINPGGELNIDGGILKVSNGITINNRGRFTGINGSLLQCLYIGCGNSGAQASGSFNTLDGGYTRMVNMTIQIARSWTTTNSYCGNGKLYIKDCCVKTGKNFSINNENNRDTLINTRFEIGLHGSGNFRQYDGNVYYSNIDIDIAGLVGGNVQFSDGNFTGTIRTIRIQNIIGKILASSYMSGNINLNYYCIPVPLNYQDPANRILNEQSNCVVVNTQLSDVCGEGPGHQERTQFEVPAELLQLKSPYPNPFINTLEIEFMLSKATLLTITLTDITGRQVYKTTSQGTPGFNRIKVDKLMNLKSGVYIVKVISSEKLVTLSKVVKK